MVTIEGKGKPASGNNGSMVMKGSTVYSKCPMRRQHVAPFATPLELVDKEPTIGLANGHSVSHPQLDLSPSPARAVLPANPGLSAFFPKLPLIATPSPPPPLARPRLRGCWAQQPLHFPLVRPPH
jgi:hypothetical protein